MYKSANIVGIYGWAAKLAILVYFSMDAFAAVILSLISSIHTTGNIIKGKVSFEPPIMLEWWHDKTT